MSTCDACTVEIEGGWKRCPLCAGPVTGDPVPSPLPAVPLRFSRRRLITVVFLASLALVVASFVVQLLLSHGTAGIGALRSIWLGVITMWLVVIMAVRKRRNVAKGTVYLVIMVDLICVYWDYLTGWHQWSLTYAVPIVNASSIVALLITVRAMRTEVGEYILYSGLTVLLGLVPIVLLALHWVTNPLPSAICGALSLLALMMIQLARGAEVRHELTKRLNL